MATVLNGKNGVITEERFQKMTIPQWLFHYHEIMSFRDQSIDFENKKIEINLKMYEGIKNTLKNYLEMVAVFANPQAGKQWLEEKDMTEQRKELTPEQFADEWKKIKEQIPPSIVVGPKVETNQYFLEKYKREKFVPGINIKE